MVVNLLKHLTCCYSTLNQLWSLKLFCFRPLHYVTFVKVLEVTSSRQKKISRLPRHFKMVHFDLGKSFILIPLTINKIHVALFFHHVLNEAKWLSSFLMTTLCIVLNSIIESRGGLQVWVICPLQGGVQQNREFIMNISSDHQILDNLTSFMQWDTEKGYSPDLWT